ncbi:MULTISPECIES: arginine N-succinyltransferase [Pseudomonas chlororaphis group]|uniref:arginine N-succinyltransferase n=1 Tax=Pseudomonas chlororaphis group TaxID=136842 RepID=UPI002098152A|nr:MULTISPECIES: arginine N-succinyltransferase [Pseudomonas chlororaphis group]MCO7580151.1 arginine N-succinyltransferase [Pseudomonas protegens]MCO7586060.1 arginine N-succinyltransferase [Pseudomonas chlororaphis]MCO7603126.1 arginine N-succinyltransferase [Pseudomonas chlororaphis]
MLALRPVVLFDLPQLLRLARERLLGVTSLVDDETYLRERILDSLASFAKTEASQGPENYFLVLEDPDSGLLHGCSDILATAGFAAPFYSLRNRPFISSSRELNIEHGVPTLSLCQDLSEQTLLRSFHVDPALSGTPLAQLTSRARLLFMAAHPQRFAESTISEIVGYSNAAGESPFWEAVGQHFFDLPYIEAERLCALQGRGFLAELMPQYPLYIPMLPPSAQDCIGRIHPDAREACDILIDEGFAPTQYVDLFDAGPTLQARNNQLRSIVQSRVATSYLSPQSGQGRHWLLSNDRLQGFRAIVAPLDEAPGDVVGLDPSMLQALQVTPGEPVRGIAL